MIQRTLDRAPRHRTWGTALLLLQVALFALTGCDEHAPDLIATLKGRCEGRWVVVDADRARLPLCDVPRDRLAIELASRAPLGDTLVPGETYAIGTLAWGDRASAFALDYPLGSRDLCCAYARYVSREVAPFGRLDGAGFNLLLLTAGGRDDDLLCVDFQRTAPVSGGLEHMLRFERDPAGD